MSLKTPWLLPILSGVLIGTSYIPFPPWASLFAFIPLWIFWQQQTRLRNVILSGILATFVFTLIGFNWVTYLLHEFAHLPWFAAVLGMLLFALIAHLFVPVAGILWFIGYKQKLYTGWQSILVMGLFTALSLWALPMLFKWNFGYAWYGVQMPVYQLAEYIGFSGLSMLTILANVPLYFAWQNRHDKVARNKILLRFVTVFMILNAFGLSTKAFLPKPNALLMLYWYKPILVMRKKSPLNLGAAFTVKSFNNTRMSPMQVYVPIRVNILILFCGLKQHSRLC